MSQNLILADAKRIATECSQKHIQSVIEDMQAELKIAAELRKQLLSLDPTRYEVSARTLHSLQSIARRLNKVGN